MWAIHTDSVCDKCPKWQGTLCQRSVFCCSYQSLEWLEVVSRELPNQRCNHSDVRSSVKGNIWDDSNVQAKLLQSPEEEEVGVLCEQSSRGQP